MCCSCCVCVGKSGFLNCPRVFASFQYVDALSTRWIIMGMIFPASARRRRSTQTVRPRRSGPATGRPAPPRPALLSMAEAVPPSNLLSMAEAVPRSTLLSVAEVKVPLSTTVTVYNRVSFFSILERGGDGVHPGTVLRADLSSLDLGHQARLSIFPSPGG